MSFFSKLFGNSGSRTVSKYQAVVTKINELEPTFESFSLEQLKEKTTEFKKRLSEGETLDDILPEAFAVVREVSKRTLGQRHYDVQLIGGMVLHSGSIAEMRTGEGKTLSATTAAYLNALEGKGVHIVTVNDYLSRRDAAWMGQIYSALGLTTACLNHESSFIYDAQAATQGDALDSERDVKGGFHVVDELLRSVTRREAYEADITYGTNNEFGFDYLRDNMAYDVARIAQAQGHHFAIVDEIDSILIDEARTPLIISAPDEESGELYRQFAKIVPRLTENEDFNVDEKLRSVAITEAGIEKVEQALGVQNLYEEGGARFVHHLEQALKAHVLYQRDKEYVVRDNEVIIVDEFTGRLMPGRRWSQGLHQAVEAKENVLIQKESRTLATITFQNYFRLYKKLSGMTGTAKTSEEEFNKVYNMEVVIVPTNKPTIREDRADRIYKTEQGKLKAVAREVKERHSMGQPVLIGTPSIAKNEMLSAYLSAEGVPHEILNAKNHAREGEIIAQAGRKGAVTVATNMAGRGVDIILGGNPPNVDDAKQVREFGGLYVIGTERHEARRIDNQLRGRSGRQGDPGMSQFFVSTEDEVIRVFSGDRLTNIMNTLGVGDDDMIENKLVSRAIEQAQTKIEGHHFDARKHVLEYDDVMNRHRTAMYALRKAVLTDEATHNRDRITGYVKEVLTQAVEAHVNGATQEVDTKEISEILKAMIPFAPTDAQALEGTLRSRADKDGVDGVLASVLDIAEKTYAQKEAQIGDETGMRNLEKMVLLRVIDELWVDHLDQMEYLRDSVRLRAYGQRDPLAEYKVEGQRMFVQLQSTVANQVADMIYKVTIAQKPREQKTVEGRATGALPKSSIATQMNEQADRDSNATVHSEEPKIGRNDPCPCGSGKKYKKCGLINAPGHKV